MRTPPTTPKTISRDFQYIAFNLSDSSISFNDLSPLPMTEEQCTLTSSTHQKKAFFEDPKTGETILTKQVDTTVLADEYGMTYAAQHGNSTIIEVATGALFNFFHTEQPKYQLVNNRKDNTLMVGVEYLENFKTLQANCFEKYNKGLASLLVLSLFFQEWDLKLDNFIFQYRSHHGFNHFVRIDFEWSVFSMRQKNDNQYSFELHATDFINLPQKPVHYRPFLFLGFERKDKAKFAIPESALSALSKDDKFINEKWLMVLKLLLIPSDFIDRIIDAAVPDQLIPKSDTTKDFIKTNIIRQRKKTLRSIMLKNSIFKRYIANNGRAMLREILFAVTCYCHQYRSSDKAEILRLINQSYEALLKECLGRETHRLLANPHVSRPALKKNVIWLACGMANGCGDFTHFEEIYHYVCQTFPDARIAVHLISCYSYDGSPEKNIIRFLEAEQDHLAAIHFDVEGIPLTDNTRLPIHNPLQPYDRESLLIIDISHPSDIIPKGKSTNPHSVPIIKCYEHGSKVGMGFLASEFGLRLEHPTPPSPAHSAQYYLLHETDNSRRPMIPVFPNTGRDGDNTRKCVAAWVIACYQYHQDKVGLDFYFPKSFFHERGFSPELALTVHRRICKTFINDIVSGIEGFTADNVCYMTPDLQPDLQPDSPTPKIRLFYGFHLSDDQYHALYNNGGFSSGDNSSCTLISRSTETLPFFQSGSGQDHTSQHQAIENLYNTVKAQGYAQLAEYFSYTMSLCWDTGYHGNSNAVNVHAKKLTDYMNNPDLLAEWQAFRLFLIEQRNFYRGGFYKALWRCNNPTLNRYIRNHASETLREAYQERRKLHLSYTLPPLLITAAGSAGLYFGFFTTGLTTKGLLGLLFASSVFNPILGGAIIVAAAAALAGGLCLLEKKAPLSFLSNPIIKRPAFAAIRMSTLSLGVIGGLLITSSITPVGWTLVAAIACVTATALAGYGVGLFISLCAYGKKSESLSTPRLSRSLSLLTHSSEEEEEEEEEEDSDNGHHHRA